MGYDHYIEILRALFVLLKYDIEYTYIGIHDS